MKIILSRKGWDSASGGKPNIIADGTNEMIMLPIPDSVHGTCTYADLALGGYCRGKVGANDKCHPDPNLTNLFKRKGFIGSLGQVRAAQTHLQNHGISIGDIFIFFGWFEQKHVMFGYLQIGEMVYPQRLSADEIKAYEAKYPWLKDQPHWDFSGDNYKPGCNNCIYIAAEKLSFAPDLKGYGTFTYSPALDLTKPGAKSRMEWSIPVLGGLGISRPKDAKIAQDGTFIVPPTFGQEFVLENNDKATNWAKNIITANAKQ